MIAVALGRAALFAVLWLVFAEGDLSGSIVALVAVAAATATSLWVSPPGPSGERIRLVALPRFTLYFLRRSAAGGLDVARRALDPRLPIAPRIIAFPLVPSAPRSTLFFSHVVSLLPGTLSCRLEPDVLLVHVLDGRAPVTEELERLRAEVELMFRRR